MKSLKKSKLLSTPQKNNSIFGSKLNFASSEAYKLLRTNLMFSIPAGERQCRVIGITSAIRGEGKTTTSINLAYSFAETGKRVLLIDADMRLPSIAKALKLQSRPGLSNVLIGLSDGKIPLQKSELHDSLYVITSGDIPPNPSELLGAKSMELVIDALSESFDYIIIDLPPVTVVSDALVITPLCDGVLLVVRQDYVNKREVADAVDQLTYCKAKVLGYVLNDTNVNEKSYRRGVSGKYYSRYKKYGSYNYGYGYGYGYGKTEDKKK